MPKPYPHCSIKWKIQILVYDFSQSLKIVSTCVGNLDGRVDFLQGHQICKASKFRWKVFSEAWIASYGSASSKKRKNIPLYRQTSEINCRGYQPKVNGSLIIASNSKKWQNLTHIDLSNEKYKLWYIMLVKAWK